MPINQSINQSIFVISGMTERRPRIHNKHNIHSNSSRVTCLIFVFIEHSVKPLRRYGHFSIFQDGSHPLSWICYTRDGATNKEYLLAFVNVQNLAVFGAVVSTVV